RPGLFRFHQAAEKDLGGAARQDAVIVDDERHGPRVAGERLAAALAPVALAQLPFDAVGQWLEVLDDEAAVLGAVQDSLPNSKGRCEHVVLVGRAHRFFLRQLESRGYSGDHARAFRSKSEPAT